MNRPQKNKLNNPTLPEEQQNLVDERNFVDVQESEEISVEDRIRMYWMENKSFISSCIFMLALVIGSPACVCISHAESKLQIATRRL